MQNHTLVDAPIVRPLAPRTALREGYRSIMAASEGLGNSVASTNALDRLRDEITVKLRGAMELVLLHPTLPTLRDGFDALNRARMSARKAATAGRSSALPGCSVKVELALAEISASLALLEQGLESIELLPARVADYPWEQGRGGE